MQSYCWKRSFLQSHNILEIIAKSCLSRWLLITWQMETVCFQTELKWWERSPKNIKWQSKSISIIIILIVRITFMAHSNTTNLSGSIFWLSYFIYSIYVVIQQHHTFLMYPALLFLSGAHHDLLNIKI